jgi:hypothetical protein
VYGKNCWILFFKRRNVTVCELHLNNGYYKKNKKINKIARITTYLSIITLNGNGLNSLIKRHRVVSRIKKQDLTMPIR